MIISSIHANLPRVASLFGILVCAILVSLASAYQYHEAKNEFISQTVVIKDAINTRLSTADEGIQGLYTLFSSTLYVDPEQYRQFADNLLERHDFIKSVSYLPHVIGKKREMFQQFIRSEGWNNYEIKIVKEEQLLVAPEKPRYFPVLHHEPIATLAEEQVGFDLSSIAHYDVIIREAILNAEIASSSPSTFHDGTSGVVFFKAIYSTNQSVSTAQQRSEHVNGILVLRIDLNLIMSNIPILDNIDIYIDSIHKQSKAKNNFPTAYKFTTSGALTLPKNSAKLTVTQKISVKDIDIWLVIVALIIGIALMILLSTLARNITLRSEELKQRNREIETVVKLKTKQLSQEKQRAQVTLGSIADAVVTVDRYLNIEYMNPAAETLCGCRYEKVKGEKIDDYMQVVAHKNSNKGANKSSENNTNKPPALSTLEQCVTERRLVTRKGVGFLLNQNGNAVAIDESASPIFDDEQITGAVLVFRDVSIERSITEKMTYRATHDSLTDLPNRALLLSGLEQLLIQSSRRGDQVAVMFLDLDGFKAINDNYGHDVGDDLLKLVANRLSNVVRESDMVARIGGDEFVITVGKLVCVDDIYAATKRIIGTVNKTFYLRDHQLKIGTSIGVALYPESGNTPEVLLKNADVAMYRAKTSGKNRMALYSEPPVSG